MELFKVYSLLDMEPVKAHGAYLWDRDGVEYLDFYGGHAVISIGHTHPHYVEVISSQLEDRVLFECRHQHLAGGAGAQAGRTVGI